MKTLVKSFVNGEGLGEATIAKENLFKCYHHHPRRCEKKKHFSTFITAMVCSFLKLANMTLPMSTSTIFQLRRKTEQPVIISASSFVNLVRTVYCLLQVRFFDLINEGQVPVPLLAWLVDHEFAGFYWRTALAWLVFLEWSPGWWWCLIPGPVHTLTECHSCCFPVARSHTTLVMSTG